MDTTSSAKRFTYKAGNVGFYGRDDEMKQLRAFCFDDAPFLWWAITGPGGAGKSRMAYELGKELKKKNWFVCTLTSVDYENLGCTPLIAPSLPSNRNTLVIADYVQGHARDLGRWMQQTACQKVPEAAEGQGFWAKIQSLLSSAPRVRFLLLERDSKKKTAATPDAAPAEGGLCARPEKAFASQEEAPWVAQLLQSGSSDLGTSRYRDAQGFLQVPPLSDKALRKIMQDYCARESRTGRRLSEAEGDQLVKALDQVDPGLKRPLFALFIADAVAQGRNPLNWDRAHTLAYIISREDRLLAQRVQAHLTLSSAEEHSLCSLLKTLRALATVYGGPLYCNLPTQTDTKALWDKLCTATNDLGKGAELGDLLQAVGMLGRMKLEDGTEGPFVPPLEPDLLGEYDVLQKLGKEGCYLHSPPLHDALVQFELPAVHAFIRRLMQDYPEELKDQAWFWEKLWNAPYTSAEAAAELAHTLFCVTWPEPFAAKTSRAVDALAQLHQHDPGHAEIALWYAKGLVNLSCDQDLAGREGTMQTLRALHEDPRFRDNAEIALAYARGLVSLSFKQDLAGCEETAQTLRALHEGERFQDNPEIALEYAKGLFNLSCDQDLAGREETVQTLRALHEDACFRGNAELAVVYASGLVNLSTKQDLADCEKTVQKLRELHEDEHFRDNPEIALEYAKGLFNLSCDQDLAGRAETVQMLRALHEDKRFQDNAELAILCAKGLVNLSNNQDLAGREEKVQMLRALHEDKRFQDNAELAILCAKGLVNLSNNQDLAGREGTMQTLRALHEDPRFRDNAEIALAYARGLFNLSCDQDLAGRAEAVQTLRALHEDERFQDNAEIAIGYAKGLVNLSNKQNLAGREETVQTLRTLHEDERFLDNSEIACVYASGLVNLSNKQDLAGREETVHKLRTLHEDECFRDNAELAGAYALGLENLMERQAPEAAKATYQTILELHNAYPGDPDTQLALIWVQKFLQNNH